MEKLIISFNLSKIESLSFINHLCDVFYRRTAQKLQISFNGSKGYLSTIEFSCEDIQRFNNRIFINENVVPENILVSIFHSRQDGIRISTNLDLPQHLTDKKESIKIERDLPF